MSSTICIWADAEELAQQSAEHIAAKAGEAVEQHGKFTLCLSGGDTPVPTYSRLADLGDTIDWERVHVFWGDERCIPLERPDNHFTMASELLLSRVPIPPENVHRAHGESSDPPAAARAYEDELTRCFGGELPRFDLVLLGMGSDGHVASLFPGSVGLEERTRWTVDHYVIKNSERVRRLTLTMPVLTAAREVMFIVSGDQKAQMLASVLEERADVPAREVNQTAAEVRWMIDRAAAAELDQAAVESEIR